MKSRTIMRMEGAMKKETAIILISLMGICAISSVAVLVYVMISPSSFIPATSSIQSTPMAVVYLSTSVPPPTFTPTPTLVPAVQTSAKGCLTSLDYLGKIEIVAGS